LVWRLDLEARRAHRLASAASAAAWESVSALLLLIHELEGMPASKPPHLLDLGVLSSDMQSRVTDAVVRLFQVSKAKE
jgi:hypothetical protein